MKSRKKSLSNGEVKQEPVEIVVKQEPAEFIQQTGKERKTMMPGKELKELAVDPESCLSRTRSTLHVALHPKCLSNLTKGLVTHFNKQINCYHSELDGILAGYGKLYLRHSTGALLNEETHVHVDVVSDFWVFRPIVGATLKGTVNETSPTHVSVIVHGCFNVPCYKPPDLDASLWHGSRVQMGDTVRLCILRTDMSQKIPYLVGSLIADPSQEQKGAKSRKRKHQQMSSDTETQEEEDTKDLLIKSITEKVKKKRKTK